MRKRNYPGFKSITKTRLALILLCFAGIVIPQSVFCLSDLEIDILQAGFNTRRNQVLQQQVAKPYPSYNPDPGADNGWHWLDFALSAMYMNQNLPEANDAVTTCVQYFENLGATNPTAFFGLDGNFHWRAPQLLRIYDFFHSGSAWPG